MKAVNILLSRGLLSILILAVVSFDNAGKQVVIDHYDVFEGTSPCARAAKSFLQIPASDKCEYVKWHLILHSPMACLFSWLCQQLEA